ncbi:MAG TPA: glycosyltransferase family 2 protein [Bacteroidetes bacterium]|nr:glycosyltransferase family 2 protein [Bacteroidota bacterium]
MATVSVLIITLNEEKNIRRCLESVKWADEMILIDAQSSDRTVEIAREYTDKIFIRKWEGFGGAKNFANRQASSDWLFWIDADEEVSPALAEEIKQTLDDPQADGYFVPRLANFLGRWIKHSGWYPGYILRPVRRELAKFSDLQVHEGLIAPPKSAKLKNPLFHYTDPSIRHYFEKLNNYTSLAAMDLQKRGKQFRISDLIIRPLHIIVKMYILRCGFLDGFQGFLLALFSGVYVFVKYAKLWEIQKNHVQE